jgi:hypothetical protein
MTTIGILGTGRMALRLATLFADRGHAVTLGSRAPAHARALAHALGRPGIAGGSYADAAAHPVVLPAMFLRDGLLDTLEPHRTALAGKLLIDITNPFNDRYDDFILPWDTSGAEELQRRFPGGACRRRLQERLVGGVRSADVRWRAERRLRGQRRRGREAAVLRARRRLAIPLRRLPDDSRTRASSSG